MFLRSTMTGLIVERPTAVWEIRVLPQNGGVLYLDEIVEGREMREGTGKYLECIFKRVGRN